MSEDTHATTMPLQDSSFDAELLAKIDGTPLSVGYHNPFLLTDPSLIWLVLKGSVDIFAVPLHDGQVIGTGTHLLRVQAGDLIFGMAPCSMSAVPVEGVTTDASVSAQGWTWVEESVEMGLRAVATMGTELFRAHRRDLEHDEFDITVVDWIDRWLSQIAEVIVPHSGPRPTAFLEAEPRQPFAAASVLVPQREAIVWVRLDQGTARVSDQWSLSAETVPTAEDASPIAAVTDTSARAKPALARMTGSFLTPMTGNLWLTCETACTLSAVYTPTALFQNALWPSLEAFHNTAMQVIAMRIQQQHQHAAIRWVQKTQASRATFQTALRQLGDLLRSRVDAVVAARPTDDPLYEAARHVGAAQGISLAPPVTYRARTQLFPLDDIARRSHFRTRLVLLRDDWYHRDNGPLLAFYAADQRPVALLPDGATCYRLFDPTTGQQQRVTAALALQLTGRAYLFYRPFPAQPMSLHQVIAFGQEGLQRDIQVTFIMGVFAGLMALAVPLATSQLFSSIIPRADGTLHQTVIIGLILAALGATAVQITRRFATLRVQTRMDIRLQTAVWDRLLALPIPFFRDYSSGDLADRAHGIQTIRELLSTSVTEAMMNLIFSVFSLFLLFWYSSYLALWVVTVVIAVLILSAVILWLQLPLQRALIASNGLLEGLVFQMLSGLTKLRLSASEPRAFARWAEQFGANRNDVYQIRQLAALQAVLTALFPLLAAIVFFAALGTLLNQPIPHYRFGVGDFLAFTIAFGQFSAAMVGLLGTLMTLTAIVPLYERLRPILQTVPEVSAMKADPGVLDGTIELSNLVFRYDPSTPPVINGVSVTIASGRYVAFVGASGSGKSTLIRLILGFEKPESGGVYIDGKDLAGLDTQAVRRQMGVVLQQGRILAGSIYENIVSHLPLTVEDAWEAARMAGLAEDIEKMPMGMHTVLSEGAGTLSGGQRQRLMIARALVHKPRILLLDEATSALDNRTQAVVHSSLARMNMTRLVVAHRLSTIEKVDCIYVLKQGRIVEQGSFNALMARGGEFAALARHQML